MTKKKSQFYVPQRFPTDEVVRSGLKTLIANLIVPHRDGEDIPEYWDRTVEMNRHIPAESFPWDMEFESKLIGLIYQHSINDVPPTLAALKTGMRVQYNLTGAEVEKQIDDIAGVRTVSADVVGISYWLHQELSKVNLDMALDEARGILRSPYGTLEDRQTEIFSTISDAIEFDDDLTDMSFGDAVGTFVNDNMHKTWEIVQSGGWVGPSLKFRGFTHTRKEGKVIRAGSIPFLRWGSTTLVTAKRGRGKTTFAQFWAEYNAWIGGYDVLYMHTETPLWQLVGRSIARNFLYPSGFLSSGSFDTHDETSKHALALRRISTWAKSPVKIIQGSEYTVGALHYKHVAGWNMFRINNYISTFCRKAAARGTKGVLVIVDYYNNITPHTTGNTADQLGQISLTLRNGIMRENAKVMNRRQMESGVHCIVFAQESDTGDTPYGSTQIAQYSQIHISIDREQAKVDLPLVDSKGKPVLNAIGEPRMLHKASDYDSLTTLRVVKANEDSRTPVQVIVENNLFRPYDTDGKGNLGSIDLF